VLDLSNVTHVDSTGLGALLGAWKSAQSKGCELEIANLNPRVEKLVEITKLYTVFKRARVVAAERRIWATNQLCGNPLIAG
jgi:anti-anti-sigma factor